MSRNRRIVLHLDQVKLIVANAQKIHTAKALTGEFLKKFCLVKGDYGPGGIKIQP